MYTEQEAKQATLDYFNGDELAADVFLKKYALRNDKDELMEKTPDDMHWRIANEFARIEAKKFKLPLGKNRIYNFLKNFKYIVPQGSPMFGIGNNYQIVSLSNCYVLETPEDSYNSILDIDKQLVNISKRRGGVGIDLSKLRPEGFPTKNAAKSSTGVPSFAERYSNSIREVGQKNRRGALMLTLSIHHPDILKFITMKNDPTKVTGANISVKLSSEFFEALKNDTDYELRFPVDSPNPTFKQMISAKEVWKVLIHSAWLRAEPGLLMWDNILCGPADCYTLYRSSSTNPCSEIPLACLDSCRLLVLMLLSFVKNPFTKDAYFDYNSFYEAAQIAQRLMDDLVDLESEKIDKIIEKVKSDPESYEIKRAEIELWQKIKKINDEGRRTGLGVTAVGDTLAALGIKYGSDESIKVVDEIYKTLKFGAYRASVDMAKELGPFVGWNPELEKDCDFLNRFRVESILAQDSIDGQPDVYGIDIFKDMQKYGRRNVALLTTAPTGSLSLLTQTTSGIEPLFRIEPYIRRRKLMNAEEKADFVDQNGDRWQEYPVYHPTIQMWMDITKETDLTKSPWYGATANDIDWINRVRLQAAAQKHICHAISSTINLPNNVTEETVSQIYLEAYKSGCKGMTIYRDGCRSGVLIEKKNDLAVHHAPDRPKELPCDVHHVTVKGKKYFVIIGLFGDSKQPYEVFAGRGDLISNEVKKGKIIKVRTSFYKAVLEDDTILSPITLGCNEEEEAITRLTSMALRHGAPVQFVLEQLAKIDTDISSFIKAVSRALKKYVPDETKSSEKCKECEGELVYSDGCVKCSSCGWSKC